MSKVVLDFGVATLEREHWKVMVLRNRAQVVLTLEECLTTKPMNTSECLYLFRSIRDGIRESFCHVPSVDEVRSAIDECVEELAKVAS